MAIVVWALYAVAALAVSLHREGESIASLRGAAVLSTGAWYLGMLMAPAALWPRVRRIFTPLSATLVGASAVVGMVVAAVNQWVPSTIIRLDWPFGLAFDVGFVAAALWLSRRSR